MMNTWLLEDKGATQPQREPEGADTIKPMLAVNVGLMSKVNDWLYMLNRRLRSANRWLRWGLLYTAIAGFWLSGLGLIHFPSDIVAMCAFGAMWIAIRTDMRERG